MPTRRAVTGTVAAVVAALLAGCGSSDADHAPDSPTDPPDATPRPPGGPTDDGPTPTPIGETTPREPVGTGRNPADVVLSNATDRSRSVSVTVRRRGATDSTFDRTVTVAPGGRHRLDVFAADATGAYVLRFRLPDGTARRYEWALDERSEDGWLSVGVSTDGEFVVTYAMA